MTNIPLTGQFRVTCQFKKPGKWAAGWHTGIDLVSDNTTIYSSCDGKVVRRGYDNSYGNFIVVQNANDGKYHWFCHLSKISKNTGSSVTRTTVLGIMGNTGNSTGRHLHFEIRNASNKYGDVSNPADYMGIPNQVGSYNSNNYPLYRVHMADLGWGGFVPPYNIAGTTGQSRRIEAMQLMSNEVEYRTHLQDVGWTGWQKGGTMCGTTGQSRRLEAIEFRSSRDMAAEGHVQNIGWQGERRGKNIVIGTTGRSLRLEAFKFKFI